MNLHHQMLPGAGHMQEGGHLPGPVSKRGSYNAAKVWCECIIMALLGGGYVHYNVCSIV